jgi:DNA modification methylase
MGSGTTLIAAEMTGRVCLGLELNPAYVDVAVTRWQDFTGEVAVLESTGQAFGARSDAQASTNEETDSEADGNPG